MKKEMILQRLKENGCRITKQRKIILDIILQDECSSCKEIYYEAVKKDSSIGIATVYRMVNALEEIGVIHPQNMYHISCEMCCSKDKMCTVELDDETICRLSNSEWYSVISAGLKSLGYIKTQRALNVIME